MNNRLLRVRELMKRELGEILTRDFEFGGALVSINDIDMTPDLKQAHVYLGIIGREDLQRAAMRKLEKARVSLQAKLSKRVIMKQTAQLHFKLDNSVERGVHVLNIMEEVDKLTPADAPPLSDEERALVD